MNALGQAETISLGNDCVTDYAYDSYFRLSKITIEDSYSTDLIDLDFNFNANTGNLSSREDNINTITESFTYDNLNRLTATTIGATTYSTAFSSNGNINSKTDVGSYTYDATKKHAIATVTGNTGSISSVQQDIDYTTFNKINGITEGDYSLEFLYGPDDQRKRMCEHHTKTLTYYLGNFEIVENKESVKYYHYINGADGLDAIYICDEGDEEGGDMYYVGKDHLGSIIALIDSDEDVVESFNYDAWGRRRNPTTWTFTSVPDPVLITRGYTGHEHLDDFKLINMNGRVYDPILGRMLSPDPFVQAPGFSQSYNRYAYVYNNPLKYTDPSGYITIDSKLMRWIYFQLKKIRRGLSGEAAAYGYFSTMEELDDSWSQMLLMSMSTSGGGPSGNSSAPSTSGGGGGGGSLFSAPDSDGGPDGDPKKKKKKKKKKDRPLIRSPYGPEIESSSSWTNLRWQLNSLDDMLDGTHWSDEFKEDFEDAVRTGLILSFNVLFPPSIPIITAKCVVKSKEAH
jgi:RHS repeat-associated protein